jgi:RimJ/RimL family protein N-acetyltransferase
MIQITPAQMTALRDWFLADRPGPQIGLHVIHTGNGACFVDRWPDPQAVLIDTAGNYLLAGHPDALDPADLEHRISGFVEAPDAFAPLLREAFPSLKVWERVVLELRGSPHFSMPSGYVVRRLGLADIHHLWGLGPELAWIGKTWGGPSGLASSGHLWGALAQNRLISVACTFFVGDKYEDIGVATQPEFRGLGLSAACAGALCEDIRSRGRRPSWTTSPDNTASVRVAEKLGFSVQRKDRLYVIGRAIPEPPRRQPTEGRPL